MRLRELARAGLTLSPGSADIAVTGIAADSRLVHPGWLFVALKGATGDGARFASSAVEAGAVAVLADEDAVLELAPGVPVLRSDDARRALALAAALFHPRQPEHLVAVTGTSGKTSVAAFARQIFAAAGFEAASIGTIGIVTGRYAEPGSLTTPDPVALHEMLDRLAGEGVTHAAMEASSHGLDQRRLDGVRLEAAGFTNLGRDHMDYHATIADYLAAKLRLFADLLPEGRTAVIDADATVAADVEAVARSRRHRLVRTGRKGTELRLVDLAPDGFRQRLTVEAFGRQRQLLLPLAGAFQAANALVAAGLAIGAGVEAETALAALERLEGAPGRLERVGETASGGLVFVDYAHKPDAIEAVLTALRPMTRGRLIVMIGAGGDRDAGKRPLMGEAAARNADIVIVTDDNPRSEDPAAIRAAVLAGAPGAIEIGDRGRAIAEAVAMLGPGDVLCVAGKGHETGQKIGTVTHPFSDREAVLTALKRLEAA